MRQILVLNSGSSSIKYELFDMDAGAALESGLVERIGEGESCLKQQLPASTAKSKSRTIEALIPDHRHGIELISRVLAENERFEGGEHLVGIGHRAVHGGERFSSPTLIDDRVIESIRELVPLAPLHNPANLVGMEVARSAFPGVPQVAVFDTAYHQTLPRYAYHYTIPHDWYQRFHIRRYGFHGISHHYIHGRAVELAGGEETLQRVVTCHLGAGCSISAVKDGRSVDTSMGFTPLEGLVMGTRSGDLDPAIVHYLLSPDGGNMTDEQVHDLLNRDSGLKGLSGLSADVRDLLEARAEGHEGATVALSVFTYRLKKYIAAYHGVLGGAQALVFAGGIGENSPEIRAEALDGLHGLGFVLDQESNAGAVGVEREITGEGSAVRIFVIPTDEDRMIFQEVKKLLR